MKLYYMPGACSLADHIALEWTGQSYETHKLSHDDLKKEPFLKVNPLGAVPALQLKDRVLTQNSAILNYLADSHPDAKLSGDGTAESRAEVNRWLGFVNADVHPAFKPLFGATAYLEDEAAIEHTKDNARQTLRGHFQLLNEHLKDRNWLAGTRSIADPYLFVVFRWAKLIESMKIDLSGLDHLERFFERMNSDAGVKRALEAEGLV
ncbi:MAG TPA: glutathione S-transferase N-terminal domain-containing protein [Gammaproteobacteria bacterium]|nr:glutathione S-transferase N-terminal domain-containing protein [Gammaproteobacteria bacterium]